MKLDGSGYLDTVLRDQVLASNPLDKRMLPSHMLEQVAASVTWRNSECGTQILLQY